MWKRKIGLIVLASTCWLLGFAPFSAELSIVPWAARQAVAQDASRPAVVVSLASLGETMLDINYVFKAAGTPELGGAVTFFSAQYVAGIDNRRPSGAYLSFGDGEPSAVIFLPVTDFKQVLETIKLQVGEPEAVGSGVLKLPVARPVFLKERTGWVFISNSSDKLINLPADPSVALGELPKQYNVAIQIQPRNIPQHLRDTAISEMNASFERRLRDRVSNADERASQEAIGRGMLKTVASLIDDADQITVGLAIDAQAKTTYLDASVTAVPGTNLAKQLTAMSKARSQFGGFQMSGTAASLNFTSVLSPEDVTRLKTVLAQVRDAALKKVDEDQGLRDPQARETIKETLNRLVNAVATTVESGRLDGGAALILQPSASKFIAGGYVADPDSVETAIKKLVEVAKNAPNFPGMKFDAARHGNVRFHTMSIAVPAHEDQSRKLFGEQVDVSLGIGEKSVYLAFGRDAMGSLVQAIEGAASNGNQPAIPLKLALTLTPIFDFASSIDRNPMVGLLAKSLKESGRDQITVTTTPIANGATTRLQLDEGLLQAAGKAAKAAQQGNR